MGKIENATQWMINLANDNSHGYDQTNRWGPNYDCSSAIITAWQQAGVPVKTNGATYTGNMKSVFLRTGFSEVISQIVLSNGSNLKRGDVLLNESSHTAMYIGNGQIVHASINEFGGTTGGQSGDQNGQEICIRSYYNKPWNSILRYKEGGTPDPTPSGSYIFSTPQIKLGSNGVAVLLLQEILLSRGIYTGGLDRDFGNTTNAALKSYQASRGLAVDGVCGVNTWNDLLALPVSAGKYVPENVSKGANNTSVLLVQEILKSRGYYNGGLDRNFGSKLHTSVVKYQTDRQSVGIAADGVVGPKTWSDMIAL